MLQVTAYGFFGLISNFFGTLVLQMRMTICLMQLVLSLPTQRPHNPLNTGAVWLCLPLSTQMILHELNKGLRPGTPSPGLSPGRDSSPGTLALHFGYNCDLEPQFSP